MQTVNTSELVAKLEAIQNGLSSSVRRLTTLINKKSLANKDIAQECFHLTSLHNTVHKLLIEIDPKYESQNHVPTTDTSTYSVIGVDPQSGQISCHHVDAKCPEDAFLQMGEEHGYLEPIVALLGAHSEGDMLFFPDTAAHDHTIKSTHPQTIPNANAKKIPKQPTAFNIDGFSALRMNIYGPSDANPLINGYFVTKNGVAHPMIDLSRDERNAVRLFMSNRYPKLSLQETGMTEMETVIGRNKP